jgi:carbon storage regulator CsrA
MLVLTRKRGERILVPQYDVEITVVSVHGNTVRLGVAAPKAIAVYREEVWRKFRGKRPGVPVQESGVPAERGKDP